MTESAFENMIKNAVIEMHLKNLNELPPNDVLKNEYEPLSDSFYYRINKLIHRFHRREILNKIKNGILIAAACITIFVSIYKPELIVKAKDVIVKWFEEYILFQYEESGTILEKHEITYVPDGYSLTFEEWNNEMGIQIYTNNYDCSIEYICTVSGSGIEVDNKEKEFEIIYNDETELYYLESTIGEDNILVWQDKNKEVTHTIFTTLGKEEILKIQEHIR